MNKAFSEFTARWLPRIGICATAGSMLSKTAIAASIVVGQVAPLSGLRAGDARGYSAGIQMYFNHINKAGGINGNTLVLVRKDDSGRADQTLSTTEQLLREQRPVLLAGFMGSRNLAALQESGLLAREKIALIGYRSGAFQPDAPQFYNVRADLRDEIGKITEHLATVGVTQLGLLYEHNNHSPSLLVIADEATKKYGGKLIAKASYVVDTLKVDSASQIFLSAKPQAIILVTSGAAASAFVEQYRLGGGRARLFASSDVDLEQMSKRLAEEHMQGISIAQITPNPYRISNRLTKEFLEVQAKNGDPSVPISYPMMEGYIAAKVIVEAVRRAGKKLTREGVTMALDSIDSFDIGGYTISYQAGQRTGSHFVELTIVNARGQIRQ